MTTATTTATRTIRIIMIIMYICKAPIDVLCAHGIA